MNLESIQQFLTNNTEYSWLIIIFLAFAESFLITGVFISSAILFSVCIFLYNMDVLTIFGIVPLAIIGAHTGDVSSFFLGKTLGPQIINSRILIKRQKTINRAQKFLDKFGPYTVLFGRFIPAVRALTPFLLGVSDVKAVRFYIADVIACLLWGTALGFLVIGIGAIFN
ncbi:DedA family protein [Gammaproteobacteria bacterium]|jgi:membrane protein DedA with SNARE-associated domain|nr:DedA family protein [Gammaproteobacteria bacterium]MDB9997558.1 DedA family protein [Gammaproteobacteria bacterium]MDC1190746.1 DedA family protein [Gammaproteobacteria bacterium]|tara:strand:+ start:170 stop:676 length:507 start_codon:yes stop_codon:yes gene_type:complete